MGITATGDTNEANLYDEASATGLSNAAIEGVSGQLQQYQTQRQVLQTLGAQRSGIAGAGFQQSGTALDLARSSMQQGLLQEQVQGVNSDLAAGGFFTQAAASAAQASAANTAASAANANATGANNIADLAKNQVTTMTGFLNQIPGAANIINSASNPQPQVLGQSIAKFTGGSYGLNGTANQTVNLPGITPTPGPNTPTAPAPSMTIPTVI